MDFIAEALRELGPQPVLNETIRLLLDGSPEAILQWEEKSRPGFDALIVLRNELSALGAPGETIQRLIAWVVESVGGVVSGSLQRAMPAFERRRRPRHGTG